MNPWNPMFMTHPLKLVTRVKQKAKADVEMWYQQHRNLSVLVTILILSSCLPVCLPNIHSPSYVLTKIHRVFLVSPIKTTRRVHRDFLSAATHECAHHKFPHWVNDPRPNNSFNQSINQSIYFRMKYLQQLLHSQNTCSRNHLRMTNRRIWCGSPTKANTEWLGHPLCIWNVPVRFLTPWSAMPRVIITLSFIPPPQKKTLVHNHFTSNPAQFIIHVPHHTAPVGKKASLNKVRNEHPYSDFVD